MTLYDNYKRITDFAIKTTRMGRDVQFAVKVEKKSLNERTESIQVNMISQVQIDAVKLAN